MASTMAPLRCIGIHQAVLAGDGSTVLLELAMANGKTFPLELTVAGVELMSRALFAAAQALGDAHPTERPLAETSAEQAVQFSAQAQQARPQPGGATQLLLRAGCIDLAVTLPGGD